MGFQAGDRCRPGQVKRYKARLVAKGFKQRDGIDFDEVFAPVSKYATPACLACFGRRPGGETAKHKTAFLNGVVEEDISVVQPPGYATGNARTVCHLQRALYGLRQYPTRPRRAPDQF